MKLKYKIEFKLRPYGKSNIAYQIQMHVTFNSQRIRESTGCQISTMDAWDEKSQLVKHGYIGSKGETDITINNTLRNERDQMELAFKFFEVNDIIPTPTQVTTKYKERLEGVTPQRPEPEKKKTPQTKEPDFMTVFSSFLSESGEKNAWTTATYQKMYALKEDLISFKKNVSFSDLTESGLTEFVRYLREDKRLRTPRKKKGDRDVYNEEDIVGLKNSTIDKKLGYLKWFLKWATTRGLNTNIAYKTFRPTLKTTQKRVIFLTKAELESLKSYNIPTDLSHLEMVRDVFLFCCFSGLRHSDVFNLRRNDIKGDHIEVTTIKTADSVQIELNAITRNILEKYKDFSFDLDKALPVIHNQPMNRELKELCRLAGINEKIRITTYKGNQRKDEIKEKWELIGTHTGRRTFIVNCLSLGIAPNVVMKWTGHSDYKSMKPYIDIIDEIKKNEMTKLDSIL